MHILPPETNNCPSWLNGRERMTVENISWSISTKECCRPRRERGGCRTHDLLVSSRPRIQMSHRGRHRVLSRLIWVCTVCQCPSPSSTDNPLCAALWRHCDKNSGYKLPFPGSRTNSRFDFVGHWPRAQHPQEYFSVGRLRLDWKKKKRPKNGRNVFLSTM